MSACACVNSLLVGFWFFGMAKEVVTLLGALISAGLNVQVLGICAF